MYDQIPAGVVSVLTSSTVESGVLMTTDPRVDMITFTGSTPVGKAITVAASDTLKKTFLELGGKSACLVLDDESVDFGVMMAAMATCSHAGQGCAILSRLAVPRDKFDGAVEIVGPGGPVPFVDLFQGRDELVVYQHMWYDGAPHQGQCEGCTFLAWHVDDAVYLNARGVSFAVLTSGPWDEVAPFVEFMGYTQPWYSVRGVVSRGGGRGSLGFSICRRC